MFKTKGFIITAGILIAFALFHYGKIWLWDKRQKGTSDSNVTVEKIRYAKDSYIGYAPLETVEMKKQLSQKGIALESSDDGGDYDQRLQKFAAGEYDFIVLPVAEYLLHGLQYKYPGVIVSGICESKGADAMMGFENMMPTGKINDLNDRNIQFYYTAKSPSSFLLNLTVSDFDMGELKGSTAWRHELKGSSEVYDQAKKSSKNKKEVFIMWEPEVSMAIEKLSMKKLWGSDKFAGYIIDVFVFHRDFVDKHPEKIRDFLSTYFTVLDQYTTNKEDFVSELSGISSSSKDNVRNMLGEIHWYGLAENASDLFGISTAPGMPIKEGMVNSIIACNNVMYRMKTISENINDPRSIMNSSFMDSLAREHFKNAPVTVLPTSNKNVFSALNEAQWARLSEVGTIRTEDISFENGVDKLNVSGELTVDKFALMLINNYPQYRVMVKGHTGDGDDVVNLALSQTRAEIVRQRLIGVHKVDPNRIFAKGFGSKQPPARRADEDPRAYITRWPRVEFVLMQDHL